MISLLLNFFKRAIAVPLIVCIAAVIAVTAIPNIGAGTSDNGKLSEVDISLYSAKQYDRFKELESDSYAGLLFSEDFSFGKIPVLYDVENQNTVSVVKGSGEPWNGGSMLIVGKNSEAQFKGLKRAKKGDTIVFDSYSNTEVSFTVKSIVTGVRENELKSYMKQGKLVLAYPYNDFSDLGNAYYYTLLIAR